MIKPDSNHNRKLIQVLDFINNFYLQNGSQPSFRKIQKHMGYRSVRSAQDLVEELIEKSLITKSSNGSLLTLDIAQSTMGDVSDGYHTFNELYDHRITLWIALCKVYKNIAWRSKLHSDGSEYAGWFILGLHKEAGKQITYHIPLARWEEADFADTLEKAPEYDGHKSNTDTLERIKSLTL